MTIRRPADGAAAAVTILSPTAGAAECAAPATIASGRLRVGRRDGFFRKVVTGAYAIRGFSIGTDSPDRVVLQLLEVSVP